MNSVEYQQHLTERLSAAPMGSLRRCLYGREGIDATDDAIRRGLRVWAVERTNTYSSARRQTALVFGRSPSDAVRRAAAPGRLGEEIHGDTTVATEVPAEWDRPVQWPTINAR